MRAYGCSFRHDQGQVDDLLKGGGAQNHVDPGADVGEQPGPDEPQGEIAEQGEGHAASQKIERLDRLGADDPVVNSQDEQRHRQGQKIGDQGDAQEL